MIKYCENLKGASDQDINIWEVYFSQTMPYDYRQLLKKNDGPTLHDEETDSKIKFFSILQSIQYYKNNDFKEFCTNAIPICMDGHDNIAVYCTDNSLITGIFVMSALEINWEKSVEVGQSIQDLLQIVIADELSKILA